MSPSEASREGEGVVPEVAGEPSDTGGGGGTGSGGMVITGNQLGITGSKEEAGWTPSDPKMGLGGEDEQRQGVCWRRSC